MTSKTGSVNHHFTPQSGITSPTRSSSQFTEGSPDQQ